MNKLPKIVQLPLEKKICNSTLDEIIIIIISPDRLSLGVSPLNYFILHIYTHCIWKIIKITIIILINISFVVNYVILHLHLLIFNHIFPSYFLFFVYL